MMATPAGSGGGKRARTKATLVDAAWAVAEEKGFLAASLDDIAAKAGMTKGAIYSNFQDKADLMFQAAERHSLRLEPSYKPGGALRDQMQAIANAVVALLPRARGLERMNAEFRAYALTEPELRVKVAAQTVAALEEGARALSIGFGSSLALLPRELAVTIQVLSLGFIHQHLLTPDEVTEQVVLAAFEALAKGAGRSSLVE